jgi:putative N6-adenine-specific DNA methylase
VDVLTADMGLPGQVRMKESKRTPLFNGPLECRLFRFDMKKPETPSTVS